MHGAAAGVLVSICVAPTPPLVPHPHTAQASVATYHNYLHAIWFTIFVAAYMAALYFQVALHRRLQWHAWSMQETPARRLRKLPHC